MRHKFEQQYDLMINIEHIPVKISLKHHDRVDFVHELRILNNPLLLMEDYLLKFQRDNRLVRNIKEILLSGF